MEVYFGISAPLSAREGAESAEFAGRRRFPHDFTCLEVIGVYFAGDHVTCWLAFEWECRGNVFTSCAGCVGPA